MKNCVPGILIHHLPCRDRAGATCSKSWDNFLGFSKTVLLSVLPGNPALHPFIPALPPQLPQALTDSIFTEEITALFFCILILLREQIFRTREMALCCSLSVKGPNVLLVCVYHLPLELNARLSGNCLGLQASPFPRGWACRP